MLMIEDWIELCVIVICMFYDMFNQWMMYWFVWFNIGMLMFMCVLGEVIGMFVLEVVLDEMVYVLGIDLVELCLCNDVVQDLEKCILWLSKLLVVCYCVGVECFGWVCCNLQLGSMCDGNICIGWGMVIVMYLVNCSVVGVIVCYLLDGMVQVEFGLQDLGIGIYMVMIQVVVDVMGMFVDWVYFSLGDMCMFEVLVLGGL